MDQRNFFKDTSKLAFVEGTISALKRTAGTIRIGKVTRAFFRPPAHLRESEHLNAKVHFVLGFSYERLHAWLVDLGPAPSTMVTVPSGVVEFAPASRNAATALTQGAGFALPIANIPSIGGAESNRKVGVEAKSSSATRTREDLRSAVLKLLLVLVDERKQLQKPLTLAVIGSRLRERFPGDVPVHERLGFTSVRSLVASWDVLREERTEADVVIGLKNSEVSGGGGDLREVVGGAIANMIDESTRKGKVLQLPTAAASLAKLFPGDQPLFRRLQFKNLTELVRSYSDFEVVWEEPRWIVVRR